MKKQTQFLLNTFVPTLTIAWATLISTNAYSASLTSATTSSIQGTISLINKPTVIAEPTIVVPPIITQLINLKKTTVSSVNYSISLSNGSGNITDKDKIANKFDLMFNGTSRGSDPFAFLHLLSQNAPQNIKDLLKIPSSRPPITSVLFSNNPSLLNINLRISPNLAVPLNPLTTKYVIGFTNQALSDPSSVSWRQFIIISSGTNRNLLRDAIEPEPSVTILTVPVSVPEPSTLFGLGVIVGFGVFSKRQSLKK